MTYFSRFKRVLILPAFAALGYAGRLAIRKILPLRRVSLAKELLTSPPSEVPNFPSSLFRAHMTGSVDAADRICENEFYILGKGPTKLGSSTDWQKDYSCLGDIKAVWELARFQFLPTLIKVYEMGNNEKYAAAVKNLIDDFILKNPHGHGAHWQSPLEVAIRACNFAFAWEFLRISESWKDRKWQETFLTSIVTHGKFLLRNLEYGPGFNTNHLIGNFTGLFFLGTLFPQFKEARKWKALGRMGLEKEMQSQVYDDGVSYEASTSYHRFVTECFGFSALLAKANGMHFSASFEDRLKKMFEFSFYTQKPNGLAPQIGDSDDGRLFLLENYFSWDPRGQRHLVWLYEALFGVNKKCDQSKGFLEGGIYILKKNNFFCCIDAGPNGQKGNGGHAHNDTLSFELSNDGEDFLIDPGTFCYTGNPGERHHFRGTRMHNTVMIDFEEMNRFREDTVFGMQEDSQPLLHRWESDEWHDLLDAEHNGYRRLRQPVTHRRRFQFDKKNMSLAITDSFSGKGMHTLEWNFHFAPGVEIQKNGTTILCRKNSATLTITLPPEMPNTVMIHEDFVSPRYGVKLQAPVLTLLLKECDASRSPTFSFLLA